MGEPFSARRRSPRASSRGVSSGGTIGRFTPTSTLPRDTVPSIRDRAWEHGCGHERQSGHHRPGRRRSARCEVDRRHRARGGHLGQQPHTERRHHATGTPRRRRSLRVSGRHARRHSGAHCVRSGTLFSVRRRGCPSRRPRQGDSRAPVRCLGAHLSLCGCSRRSLLPYRDRHDGRRSPVTEGDVATAAAHRRRFSTADDSNPAVRVRRLRSPTSTWVGRQIRVWPSSTTGTSTGPTGPPTSRTCDAPNSSTGWAG